MCRPYLPKMSPKQNDLLSIAETLPPPQPSKERCYTSNFVTTVLTGGATFLVTLYLLQQMTLVECSTTMPETTITNRSNNLREQIITKTTNTNIDNINNSSNNNITNEKQIPLVRLPSNTLLKYTAYKDVSILHFRIPVDTQTALFSFKAYEESKSAFSK